MKVQERDTGQQIFDGVAPRLEKLKGYKFKYNNDFQGG